MYKTLITTRTTAKIPTCHDVRTASLAESSRDDIMYKTLKLLLTQNPPPAPRAEIIMIKLLLTRSSSQNPPPAPRAEIIMIKLLTNGMAEVDVACVRFPRRIGP